MKGHHGFNKKLVPLAVLLVVSLLLPAVAAAAGIEDVNSRMGAWATALKAVGITIATISAINIGYKMQFQGVPFSELGMKAVGMVIVGAAAAIAGFAMSS
jgi:hypothetical protein